MRRVLSRSVKLEEDEVVDVMGGVRRVGLLYVWGGGQCGKRGMGHSNM